MARNGKKNSLINKKMPYFKISKRLSMIIITCLISVNDK